MDAICPASLRESEMQSVYLLGGVQAVVFLHDGRALGGAGNLVCHHAPSRKKRQNKRQFIISSYQVRIGRVMGNRNKGFLSLFYLRSHNLIK